MGLTIVKGHLPAHPVWPLIKQHVRVQMPFAPNPSRIRFEFNRWKIPFDQQLVLLNAEMLCVGCREVLIHPVRKRRDWRTLYLRVTCDKKRCPRCKEARIEIDAIIEALKQR